VRILTEPENSLIKQYQALLATEGVTLEIPAPPVPKAKDKDKDKDKKTATGAATKAGTAPGVTTATTGSGTTAGAAGATMNGTGSSTTGTPAGAAAGATAGTSATAAGATGATGSTASGSGSNTAGGSGSGTTAALVLAPEALDIKQYSKLAKVKMTVSGKDIGAATLGERLVIDMPLPDKLPAAGATPDFAVRTFGPKGDPSDVSNQVLLVPQATTPPPPENVTVTPQADGIAVEWQPVPTAGAYAVYRRLATARFGAEPLALVKPPEVKFFDSTAAYGQDYIYSVTAVDPKQPLVESSPKSETEVHYVDKYPPPVPSDLVAVAETDKVRLVWRQSEASDLSGYLVYRKGAKGDFARLTAQPVSGTTFVDATAASGQAYDYRVTAIDQVGNESAPSGEVHVAVP
jgi:hypothetical protein